MSQQQKRMIIAAVLLVLTPIVICFLPFIVAGAIFFGVFSLIDYDDASERQDKFWQSLIDDAGRSGKPTTIHIFRG